MAKATSRGDLARQIFDRAHITGEFRLRSGVTASEYFDKYRFEADPALLAEICSHLVDLVPEGTEVLAGLELGGVPIATVLSAMTGLPCAFVRKAAKEYGTCRLAEGAEIAGKHVLVIEDVITSGGQVVLSTGDLRGHGAVVDHALCVIDRQAGGPEALDEVGVSLRPLFSMAELKTAGVR